MTAGNTPNKHPVKDDLPASVSATTVNEIHEANAKPDAIRSPDTTGTNNSDVLIHATVTVSSDAPRVNGTPTTKKRSIAQSWGNSGSPDQKDAKSASGSGSVKGETTNKKRSLKSKIASKNDVTSTEAVEPGAKRSRLEGPSPSGDVVTTAAALVSQTQGKEKSENTENVKSNDKKSLAPSPDVSISNGDSQSATKSKKSRTNTIDRLQFEDDGAKEQILQIIQKAKERRKPGQVIVVNDARLFDIPSDKGNVYLGHVVYTGAKSLIPHSNRAADLQLFLLPRFSQKHHYALIEVRIPAEFLTYRGNIAVRKSAVWGTDVYTDDSDVVAVVIHSGHYQPVDAPNNPSPSEENMSNNAPTDQTAVNATQGNNFLSSTIIDESTGLPIKTPISAHVQPLVADLDPSKSSATVLLPDHDLHVTLRILPKLIKYTGSTRYGLDSRGWGASHDGESISVVKIEKVPRGSVCRKGRKTFAKKWGEMALNVTKDEDMSLPASTSKAPGENGRQLLKPPVTPSRTSESQENGTILQHSPAPPHVKVSVDTDDMDGELSELTVVFSQHSGTACIKYSPRMMKDWPIHFLNVLGATSKVNSSLSLSRTASSTSMDTTTSFVANSERFKDESVLNYTKDELSSMASWPFWRVKLEKSRCILEMCDGSRYELSKETTQETYSLYQWTISGRGDAPVSSSIPSHFITWGERGLQIDGELLQPGTSRIVWEAYSS